MPGEALRELRHERGLSLEAIAVLGDIDIGTASRIERAWSSPAGRRSSSSPRRSG